MKTIIKLFGTAVFVTIVGLFLTGCATVGDGDLRANPIEHTSASPGFNVLGTVQSEQRWLGILGMNNPLQHLPHARGYFMFQRGGVSYAALLAEARRRFPGTDAVIDIRIDIQHNTGLVGIFSTRTYTVTGIAIQYIRGEAMEVTALPSTPLRTPRPPSLVRTNWISVHAAMSGGGLRYERMVRDDIAIGVIAYYNLDVIQERMYGGYEATIRFFPASERRFYVGAGLGIATAQRWEDHGWDHFTSFLFTPEIGWRFGGRAYGGGFFFNPFLASPILIEDGRISPTIRPGIGAGWAW